MVNPDWGIKRTCHSCGAKYYDFKKKIPECPSCNTVFDPEALLKSRRRAMPEEKVKKVEVLEEVVVETDDEEVEEAESDDVLENTDDLGGDDVEVAAEPVEEEK